MTDAVHVVVPGPIGQISGGYIYDRRIVAGLAASGRRVVVHELPGSFPMADEVARTAAAEIVPALRGADRIVIDGLALPAFARCIGDLPRFWIALVHHPLALETGHSPERAGWLGELERTMLRHAARVIVTSRRTALDVADLGVAPDRIGVVEPGTERRRCAPADGHPPHLLSVGALIPRKGHDLLLAALGRLQAVPWRLTLVGSANREPGTAGRLRVMVEAAGISERVEFAGEVGADRLDRLYAEADLFVLPSRHEGYGMAPRRRSPAASRSSAPGPARFRRRFRPRPACWCRRTIRTRWRRLWRAC